MFLNEKRMTATNWKNSCRLNVIVLLRFKLLLSFFTSPMLNNFGSTLNKLDNVMKGLFYFGDRIKIVNTYDLETLIENTRFRTQSYVIS